MPIFDHHRRHSSNRLAENLSWHHTLTSRKFLRHAMVTGQAARRAAALPAACAGGSITSGTLPARVTIISVLTMWSSEKQALFNPIVTPFEIQNKVTISIETSRDLDACRQDSIEGGNQADMALPLDSCLNMREIGSGSNYASTWIELDSHKGRFYALCYMCYTDNAQYQGAPTGGVDLVVALRNTPAEEKFTNYLATPDAQMIWGSVGGSAADSRRHGGKQSGFASAHPNNMSAASARQLAQTTSFRFRFGADDPRLAAPKSAFRRLASHAGLYQGPQQA